MWRFLYLFGCIFICVVRTTLQWFLKKIIRSSEGPNWSLKMGLDVATVVEAVKVLDKREDFQWKEIRFLQDISSSWLWPNEATVKKVNCNGVNGEFITSRTITDEPATTVFYLHGGGFCVGSCTSYRKPIANLSKVTKSRFLVIDYGLSPEHVYPYALEQVFEAYKWLLGQGVPASKLVVCGDSAGGGLALSLLVLLRERKVPLPCCAITISPWTNLSEDSCMRNPELWSCPVPFNDNNLAVRFANAYLGGKTSPKLPTVSPYYADLSGLPPLLIMAGGSEAILYDIEQFYLKCREQNVKVELDVVDYMPHVYQILHQNLNSEVDDAIERMNRFITQKLVQ